MTKRRKYKKSPYASSRTRKYTKKKGRRKGFGDTSPSPKSKINVKATAIATLKDLLLGILAGGVAGAVIGKPSTILGIGVTGYGHLKKNDLLRIFGIGLMAGGNLSAKSMSKFNLKDHYSKDNIKERFSLAIDSVKSKFFLDEILNTKKEGGKTINGLAEAFTDLQQRLANDPNLANELATKLANHQSQLDMQALDQLKMQIEQSGQAYQKQMKGMEGTKGSDAEFIIIDPNY